MGTHLTRVHYKEQLQLTVLCFRQNFLVFSNFKRDMIKQKITQVNSAQVKRNNACNIVGVKLILHFGAKFQH